MNKPLTPHDVLEKVPGLNYKSAYDRVKLYEKNRITKEQLFRQKYEPLLPATVNGISLKTVLSAVEGIAKSTAQQRFNNYRAGRIAEQQLFAPVKGSLTAEQRATLNELRRLGEIERQGWKKIERIERNLKNG